MTAPISNEPTTTRLHHYAGHYSDGTIARQKHLFLMPFLRAKASRVSRKRAEDPALVFTVSSRREASSFGAEKFALLGFLVVKTVQNSPCMQEKRQIGPFRACRANFVPEAWPYGSCRANFVPDMRLEGCDGRVFSWISRWKPRAATHSACRRVKSCGVV